MIILSVIGFAAQLCVIAAVAACVISSMSARPTQVSVVSETCLLGADVSDLFADVPIEDYVGYVLSQLPEDLDKSCLTGIDFDATLSDASVACYVDEFPAYDYSAITIRQLKALCKERGVKRYGNLRKHELIALLSEF